MNDRRSNRIVIISAIGWKFFQREERPFTESLSTRAACDPADPVASGTATAIFTNERRFIDFSEKNGMRRCALGLGKMLIAGQFTGD
jgi:hypothetical protein